nr:LysR family transcriptional regulator [Kineococcus aurantiacus]
MDVHPSLLRALLAVLETGTVTGASERLGFTQSAVSKQIAALEDATGVQLFHRGSRGAAPTAAAHRLAARAVVVLDQLDTASRELRDAAAPVSGRVALGGFTTAAMVLGPRTLARVALDHPAVAVDFQIASTPVQLRRLRAGRLDLALLAGGEGLPDWDLTGLDLEPLPGGELLVALSRRHHLAGQGRVPVSALAGEGWVVGHGARGEPQFGAWPTLPAPRVVAEVADWGARLGFVAAGLGLTTLPSLAADVLPADVTAVRVDDPAGHHRSTSLARAGTLGGAAAAVRAAVIAEAEAIAERWRT